jgi:uncharacterized membrane protein YhaH (DUF805 family)
VRRVLCRRLRDTPWRAYWSLVDVLKVQSGKVTESLHLQYKLVSEMHWHFHTVIAELGLAVVCNQLLAPFPGTRAFDRSLMLSCHKHREKSQD